MSDSKKYWWYHGESDSYWLGTDDENFDGLSYGLYDESECSSEEECRMKHEVDMKKYD